MHNGVPLLDVVFDHRPRRPQVPGSTDRPRSLIPLIRVTDFRAELLRVLILKRDLRIVTQLAFLRGGRRSDPRGIHT